MSVATERERYDVPALGQVASIAFSARNVSGSPLYVARCGAAVAVYVDHFDAGQWAEHATVGVVCQAVHDMSPIQLAPDGTVRPPALMVGSGRYRLRVPFGRSPATSFDRVAISNTFVVE